MYKYILYAFIFIYIFVILSNIHSLFEINRCIHKLQNFINSYNKSFHYSENRKELNSLLKFYPTISKYRNCFSPTLSYSDHSSTTFEKSKTLYSEFLMRRNFISNDIKNAFNPLTTLKIIFSLPYKIITLMGFKPRKANINIINILGWIITTISTTLINMFFDEIKAFLLSNFK